MWWISEAHQSCRFRERRSSVLEQRRSKRKAAFSDVLMSSAAMVAIIVTDLEVGSIDCYKSRGGSMSLSTKVHQRSEEGEVVGEHMAGVWNGNGGGDGGKQWSLS